MKFCSSCGWNNADTAAVCRCGKALGGATRTRVTASLGTRGSTTGPKGASGHTSALLLTLGIASAVLGALAFLFTDRSLGGVGGFITGLALAVQGLKGLSAERGSGGAGANADTGDTSVWRSPWMSFYSGSFYDAVARRTRGSGLLYLLALEAALWLVSAVLAYATFNVYQRSGLEQIVTQVPPITIRDGRVAVEATQPHYIRVKEDTGSSTLILDTTGQVTTIENQPQNILLLTATNLHLRSSSGQIRIHDLSRTKSFDVDQPRIRKWLSSYTLPVFAFGYALFVLAAGAYRMAQAAVYGGIGLVLASVFRKALPYGASFRLAIAAMTPVILVDSVLGWTRVSQASGFWWWTLCAAVTFLFLAFGVKSLEEE